LTILKVERYIGVEGHIPKFEKDFSSGQLYVLLAIFFGRMKESGEKSSLFFPIMLFSTSVAEPYYFYAAPAPTLICTKLTFLF
jgi:hypothetical protein